jgi:hypothetical protein
MKKLNGHLKTLHNAELIESTYKALIERQQPLKIMKNIKDAYGALKALKIRKNEEEFELPQVEGAIMDTLRILATLYSDSKTVIMDEPTRAFHPGMIRKLFSLVKNDIGSTKSILMISHSADILNWNYPQNLFKFRMDENFGSIVYNIEDLFKDQRKKIMDQESEIVNFVNKMFKPQIELVSKNLNEFITLFNPVQWDKSESDDYKSFFQIYPILKSDSQNSQFSGLLSDKTPKCRMMLYLIFRYM